MSSRKMSKREMEEEEGEKEEGRGTKRLKTKETSSPSSLSSSSSSPSSSSSSLNNDIKKSGGNVVTPNTTLRSIKLPPTVYTAPQGIPARASALYYHFFGEMPKGDDLKWPGLWLGLRKDLCRFLAVDPQGPVLSQIKYFEEMLFG